MGNESEMIAHIEDMGDLGTNQWPCDLMEDQRMMYHQFLM